MVKKYDTYCHKDELEYNKALIEAGFHAQDKKESKQQKYNGMVSKCTFCGYGKTNAVDHDRIIYSNTEYMLIERLFSFDRKLDPRQDNPAKQRATSQSFIHVLVIPTAHIASVISLSNLQGVVPKMKQFFDGYLEHKGRYSEDATIAFEDGTKTKTKQSKAMVDLITREIRKTEQLMKTNEKITADDKKEISQHMTTMIKATENVKSDSSSFDFFFHLTPSIWHLHMHVALAGKDARRFSSAAMDEHSIGAEIAMDQANDINNKGKCKLFSFKDLGHD
ncbi:hypothetical protein ANO11243_018050 [Dothideomycetidae sp. 11243]|nr:hypothetical protein ANO11243_018050 [fungal sp. No.11243]